MHEFIKDVGENACLLSNVICYATSYYDKLRGSAPLNLKDKALAAFAIYESLNVFETPRMAGEISFFTGISERDIWNVESNLTLQTEAKDPKKYVLRFCNLLQLSFTEQNCVRDSVEVIQQLPLGNLRCNCLVAVVINLYCKANAKKISLKKICETCDISATSVHRIIRQLKALKAQILEISGLKWMSPCL